MVHASFLSTAGLPTRNPNVKVHKAIILCRHGDRTPAFWSNPKASSRLSCLYAPVTHNAVVAARACVNANANARAFNGGACEEFWADSNTNIIPTESAKSEWSKYCPWDENNACSVTGTLTWLGAAAHQANGLWLRQRYIEEHALLSSDLKDDSELAVRSTPFPRCAQSAQNLLLGLYPPSTRGGDAANPVQTPVATTTRGFESMYGVWFSNAESCPRMIQVLHEVYRAQHQWMSDDDKALEARVTAEIGMNPNGAIGISDTIRCQQQYGVPLFNGWSDEFASEVRDYCWRTFMVRYTHPEFLGLMLGELMPQLLASLDPTATNATEQKLSVFAGHDSCPMMPALVAFGVWDGKWPDYASMLAVEVISLPEKGTESYPESQHGKDDEYFVRAFYNQKERPIVGCARAGDGLCPLNDFIAMVNSKVPKNVESACKKRTQKPAGAVSMDGAQAVTMAKTGEERTDVQF
eukprot:gene273-8712_t